MPNVNQNVIDNMNGKAKEALANGPSPVGEVVDTGPNIIRDDPLQVENLTGTTGEQDIFVFDPNIDTVDSEIVYNYEVGLDQIVFVNETKGWKFGTGDEGLGDPTIPETFVGSITIVDVEPSDVTLLIFPDDPFAVT